LGKIKRQLEKYNKLTAFFEKSNKTNEYKSKLKEYLDNREHEVMEINEEMARATNEEILTKNC